MEHLRMTKTIEAAKAAGLSFVLALSACTPSPDAPSADAGTQLPAGHPEIPADAQAAPVQGGSSGIVLETMDAAGYTYARLDMGDREVWAAGPLTPLEVGAVVSLAGADPMPNFTSRTLNRTFDELYFVGAYSAPASAQPPAVETRAAPISRGTVTQAINAVGYTYVEIDVDGTAYWLAGPETEVSVGDEVTWQVSGVMRNFASTTLNRTFDEILFVRSLRVVR
jgi:hypothetical protein